MKDDQPFERDETLSKLLRTWKPEAQLPPRFQEAVWKRIESAETDVRIPFWRLVVSRVEVAFARPALASAYVAVLLVAGVGAGYWRAEDRAAETNSELRARYVQAVDPYLMPH